MTTHTDPAHGGSTHAAPTAAPRRSPAAQVGLMLGVTLVVAAGAAALAVTMLAPSRESLPVLTTVPEFSLTEASGETVTRATLGGSPWIGGLIFTSCGGVCPKMSAEMATLVKQTKDVTGLRFVSISVDPETDTPEVLDRYAQRFASADERTRWLFLTGNDDTIRRVAREGFLLPTAEGDPSRGEDAILHSPRFVLVDGSARVRGTYDTGDPEAMLRLRGDVRRLAGERAS